MTNLDFVQLLLVKKASPNVQDRNGYTPLMCTILFAPGAAKFLLKRSTPPTTDIDIHITNRAELSALGLVRSTIESISDQAELHGCPDLQAKHDFLLQQRREIEKMQVERGSR
jgi:ankyrin repeat protein